MAWENKITNFNFPSPEIKALKPTSSSLCFVSKLRLAVQFTISAVVVVVLGLEDKT